MFDNIGVFTSHLHKHCPKPNFPKSAMLEWQACMAYSLNKRRRLRHRYHNLKNPTNWPRPPFLSTKPSCYQLKSIVRNCGDHGHLRCHYKRIFLHKTNFLSLQMVESLFPLATSENLPGNHWKTTLHTNVGKHSTNKWIKRFGQWFKQWKHVGMVVREGCQATDSRCISKVG